MRYLLFLLTFLPLAFQAQQVLYVGDGQDDGITHFDSFRDAVIASVEGDTIYVYPGLYDSRDQSNSLSLLIEHSLTLIGPGYDRGLNYPLHGLQLADATLDFKVSVVGASFFSATGLYFKRALATVDVTSVLIQRSKINGLEILSSEYVDVFQCFIRNSIYSATGAGIRLVYNEYQQISKSIISPDAIAGSNKSIHSIDCGTTYLANNITYDRQMPVFSRNTIAYNNIQLFASNMCYDPNVSGANNYHSWTGTQSGAPSCTYIHLDSTIQNLITFSGAIDSIFQPPTPFIQSLGSQGQGIGPFTQSDPYRLSGLPDLPTFYEFMSDRSGSTQSGIPVTISVKAID